MMNYNHSQPANPMDGLKRFFRSGSVLSILIIINVAVWLVIQVLKVFTFLAGTPDSVSALGWITQIFALPASLPALIQHPWTIFSYMFLHIEIWHILFNMLWLYWFGKIFMEYINERKMVAVYLLGGIAGGITYIAAFNVFPVFFPVLPVAFALGASASVMAIVTTISFYVPNYSIRLLFFGNVRIVYIAIFLFVFDFFMIPSGNAGGSLAHIGGALFGFIYAGILKRSKAGQRKSRSDSAGFNPYKRPVSDDEYNYQKNEKQRRIDEILEKISKGGYDSLTRDEKEFLFRTSGKR